MPAARPRRLAPLAAAAAVGAAAACCSSAPAQAFGLQPDVPAPPAAAKPTLRQRLFGVTPAAAETPAQAPSGIVPAGYAQPGPHPGPAYHGGSHPHAGHPHGPHPYAGGPAAGTPHYGLVMHPPVPGPAGPPVAPGSIDGPGHGPVRGGGRFGLVPDGGGAIPVASPAEPVYPPGIRQTHKHGKAWPPFARPDLPPATPSTQFHHAHYWPFPYTCRDRGYVRNLAAAQASVGYREQYALHAFHFDPGTGDLTAAGRDHLRWVVTSAAATGRTVPVVVAAGADAAVGQARLARTQAAVAEMGAPQLAAGVRLGPAVSTGRPALEIARLRAGELATMPAPRVPARTAGQAAAAGPGL